MNSAKLKMKSVKTGKCKLMFDHKAIQNIIFKRPIITDNEMNNAFYFHDSHVITILSNLQCVIPTNESTFFFFNMSLLWSFHVCSINVDELTKNNSLAKNDISTFCPIVPNVFDQLRFPLRVVVVAVGTLAICFCLCFALCLCLHPCHVISLFLIVFTYFALAPD